MLHLYSFGIWNDVAAPEIASKPFFPLLTLFLFLVDAIFRPTSTFFQRNHNFVPFAFEKMTNCRIQLGTYFLYSIFTWISIKVAWFLEQDSFSVFMQLF